MIYYCEKLGRVAVSTKGREPFCLDLCKKFLHYIVTNIPANNLKIAFWQCKFYYCPEFFEFTIRYFLK